ncbi:MAG: ribonuclease III [Planctomycetaceae bacterium]|jgi:ribonuclease-3|nr:ribonuclease III [Planctomycetaceae bacterium]
MNLETFLSNCQRELNYEFRKPELLKKALTHSSAADSPQDSNERMEFLGDSVLGYVICNHLFHSFPDMPEGDMTKIKSAVVSRAACTEICKRIGLDKYIILGRGLSRSSRLPGSLLANVMEAFIAAVFLDGGFLKAKEFILKIFQSEIDRMLEDHDAGNFKSVLQNFAQKRWSKTPDYKVIEVQGAEHIKTYHISVRIGEKDYPAAWGITKKVAEQRAAENALAVLDGEPPPYVE